MRKRSSKWIVLLPFFMTLSMYLVFSSKIASNPSEAGFWIILALGISIGVALTRFNFWSRIK